MKNRKIMKKIECKLLQKTIKIRKNLIFLCQYAYDIMII